MGILLTEKQTYKLIETADDLEKDPYDIINQAIDVMYRTVVVESDDYEQEEE